MKYFIKILMLMIVVLCFGVGCAAKQKSALKETELDWAKKVVGKIELNDDLLEITNYKCYNDNIYIVDNIAKSIHVYDFSGSHQFSFGSEGVGPGEFSGIYQFYIIDDMIVTYDYEKMKYIKYAVDGAFIEESDPKVNIYTFWLEENEFPKNLLGVVTKRDKVDGQLIEKTMLCEFYRNFDLKKELIELKTSTNEIDFITEGNHFSVNPLNNIISIPQKKIGKIEIDHYDEYGNYISTNMFSYPKIKYSNAEFLDIKETLDWHNKMFRKSYSVNDIPPFKNSVRQLKYDDHGYLWLLVNTDKLQDKMYIFDTNMNSVGFYYTTAYDFILHKDLNLEITDESITIYKYKLESSD